MTIRSASTVTRDGTVAGPVLGVDGVVLDGGVEPQAVALVAVVEGALERLLLAAAGRVRRACRGGGAWACRRRPSSSESDSESDSSSSGSSSAAASCSASSAAATSASSSARRSSSSEPAAPAKPSSPLPAASSAHQLVLALEAADVADRHLELVRDPSVGASLADPGPDLIQLGFERSPCQAAPETTDPRCALLPRMVKWLHSAVRAGEARGMLVLTRKGNQSIMIGDDIEVSVLAIMGEKVRIGIEAPRARPGVPQGGLPRDPGGSRRGRTTRGRTTRSTRSSTG